MFEPKLIARTRELLHSRPRHVTYDLIAKNTTLSKRWLVVFANDEKEHPSATRVEELYTYLTGNTLDV